MTLTGGDFKKTSNVKNRFVSYGIESSWAGARVSTKILVGGARGVNRALEALKGFSVPVAPKNVGTLRESATVKQATLAKVEGALIFDVPYAAKQHEEMDYHHDEGGPKYVERPMKEHGTQLNGIIAKEIAVEINVP